MFGIGTSEVLIILVVALVVIGPSKLPELARTLGKGLAEFRRVSSDVKNTIEMEGERLEEEEKKKKAKQELEAQQHKTDSEEEYPEQTAQVDKPDESAADAAAADKNLSNDSLERETAEKDLKNGNQASLDDDDRGAGA